MAAGSLLVSHYARSVGIAQGWHVTKRARLQPRSELEETFARDMRALNFPEYQREYTYLKPRKYRLDFAWPKCKFGVEIDGAVHRIKSRFHTDREKHALSLLEGWQILAVTGLHVRDGRAIQWAAELLFRRLFPGQAYHSSEPFSSAQTRRLSDETLFARRNAPT